MEPRGDVALLVVGPPVQLGVLAAVVGVAVRARLEPKREKQKFCLLLNEEEHGTWNMEHGYN